MLKSQVLVTGQNLVDAQPGFDQRTGEPVVTFRFDAAGAKRFAMVTQENVGLPFAIVLDNKVISAPVIREPILGGTGQISGNFTVAEAAILPYCSAPARCPPSSPSSRSAPSVRASAPTRSLPARRRR